MADQASTLAMLITRPSIWLGTIACRRLLVLMLKRIPNPPISVQSAIAAQYQRISEKTTVIAPSSISAPSATVLKDQRLRNWPAASARITTPKLPAEYNRLAWTSLA